MKIGIGILLLFFVTSLQAQNIIGKVIDNKKQPVDGATIVLQAIDSTYINASISNVDGTFVLDSQPEEYRLIVQQALPLVWLAQHASSSRRAMNLHCSAR